MLHVKPRPELYSVVALKGAVTFVATPRGEVSVCREGNVGLEPLIGGCSCWCRRRAPRSGAPAFVATMLGVYLHQHRRPALQTRLAHGLSCRKSCWRRSRIMGALSRNSPL